MAISSIIFKGFMLGLSLSVLTGPIFFTLIQQGLEKGLRAGAVLASGQWFSDFLIICLAFWGAQSLGTYLESPEFKLYLGSVGGVMLMLFGLSMLYTSFKQEQVDNRSTIKSSNYAGYFAKGFLINTINPFPILFWFSLTASSVAEGTTTSGLIVLFSTVLGMVVITDMGKLMLAKKISPYLKPQYLNWVKRFAGLILLVFGALLMWRVQ